MARRRRRGTCVYCGAVGPVTEDHIPPKGLCAKPLPNDFIVVDSCDACNTGASLDDEYFRSVLSIRDVSGHSSDAAAAAERFMRALRKPEKDGLRRLVSRSMRMFEVRSPAGLILGRRPGYEVRNDRLSSVASRCATAVYFVEMGKRLPSGWEAASAIADAFEEWPETDQQALRREILEPVLRNRERTTARGVMKYRLARASDNQDAAAILLSFYDNVHFLCLIRPIAGPATTRRDAGVQRHGNG